MKLLSLIPLYQNGGASRLLRRLYAGRELQVITLAIRESSSLPKKGLIPEIDLPLFLVHRKWMRWKLRDFSTYIRESLLFNYNSRKIRKAIQKIDFDIIHAINHGTFSKSFYEEKKYENKKIWISFHDHYRLCSSFEDTNFLWNIADRRLVISNELGQEYVKLFGVKNFELITDGVELSELSEPLELKDSDFLTVYFAGLLHYEYYPLFEVLADALDVLCEKEKKFNLVLRGTQELSFLANRNFDVEYRKNFISDEEIKLELDQASILYLPIKFSSPDFYLFSLSTKLISYLGARGTILYHGPIDAAANNLLQKHNAAISCTSLDVDEMIFKLNLFANLNTDVSIAAKKLGKEFFDLSKIQNRFWEIK